VDFGAVVRADELRDLNFKHGPKTIRIDAPVRRLLGDGGIGLVRPRAEMKRCAEALTAAEVTRATLFDHLVGSGE
jgi:hypothetical protein